LNFKVIGRRSR